MIKEILYDERTREPVSKEIYAQTERAAHAALEEFSFETGYQLSISFVEPREIRALNHQYRRIDRETDVLSFPMQDKDGRGVEILGDVVIDTERAKLQAKEYGHSEAREISYLCVHSILHLLGYDHDDEEHTQQMRQMEKLIMRKIHLFREV